MYDPERITYIGETDFRNKRVRFGIKAKDRTKHVYTIGKTGMGKSTLLENMAIQDIQNGEGIAFLDPHGKSAQLLLDYIPENRINDVLYFAPFDLEHPVAFNVMEDVGVERRHLVASGLMSAFKKIWVDAWSARMEYILGNTILALLEYPGATLIGINRMLADKEYRKRVVDNITDPSVKSFWVDEFAKYTDRFAAEATPAIQNKVGQFVSNPLIRNIIGQSKSSFDLRKMMDEGKIIIINLSKGLVGEANANLLGSMLITKVYLAAMSRADVSETKLQTLPNFYLYVDEFQSFANESFADILSEARKYKLNLTIAHQYIEQMEEEVRDAVFGNVGTMITFRVGAFDAEVLEKEYAPQFTAEDLVNIGMFQAYLKLMIDGVSSAPFSMNSLAPIVLPEISYRDVIIARSRQTYARTRAEVEDSIKRWHETPGGASAGHHTAPAPVASPVQRPPVHDTEKTVSRFSANPVSPTKQMPPPQRPSTAPHQNVPTSPKMSAHVSTPVQKSAPIREKELRDAVSLTFLKQRKETEERQQNREHEDQKRAKGPTPEHLKDLRDALQTALKNVPQQPVQTPPPVTSVSSQKSTVSVPDVSKIKEVPEDVLKNVLRE